MSRRTRECLAWTLWTQHLRKRSPGRLGVSGAAVSLLPSTPWLCSVLPGASAVGRAGGQVPRGWAWCREKAGAGRGAFTPERPGGSDRREDCRGSRLLFTKSEACHKKENKLRVAVEARPRRPFLRRRRLQPQGSVSGERTCQEQGSLTLARGCRAAPRLPGPLGFQKKTGSSRPRPDRPLRRPDPWGCTAAPGVYERSGTGPSCDF